MEDAVKAKDLKKLHETNCN